MPASEMTAMSVVPPPMSTITFRGRTQTLRLCAFLMKYVSIFSVTSKSAMTPSFIGLIATMFPGVRPSISLASRPTASIRPFTLLIATIDGSLTTIPLPRAYTHVFAVPRSIARSLEKREKRERRLNGAPQTSNFSDFAAGNKDPVLAVVLPPIHRFLGRLNQLLGGGRDVGKRRH